MSLPRTHDVTGHCERGHHLRCQENKGLLLTSTGFHWFCACICHPTPTSRDVAATVTAHDYRKAFDTWESARAALVDAADPSP